MALHEDGAAGRVDTGRQVLGRGPAGALAQQVGGDLERDGVQVHDAVERVVALLHGHPLPQRTQVVAQVQRVRRRLHAGEDPRALGGARGRGRLAAGGEAHPTIMSACGWTSGREAAAQTLVTSTSTPASGSSTGMASPCRASTDPLTTTPSAVHHDGCAAAVPSRRGSSRPVTSTARTR